MDIEFEVPAIFQAGFGYPVKAISKLQAADPDGGFTLRLEMIIMST